MANRRQRSLPAARPARRRAVSPDAEARAAARDSRRGRARHLRRPLPPPLGAAGALGRAVPARRAEQPAADGARGRAARRDPRPQRQHPRREHRGNRGGAVAGRPARRRAATRCSSGSARSLDVPAIRMAREIDQRAPRPADAGRGQGEHRPGRARLPQRALTRVPGHGARQEPRPRLPVRHARRARPRPRRRGDRGAAEERGRTPSSSAATRSARRVSRPRSTATSAARPGSSACSSTRWASRAATSRR